MPLMWLFNWLVIAGVLALVGNLPPAAAGLTALAAITALAFAAAARPCEYLVARLIGARRPGPQEISLAIPAYVKVRERLGDVWSPELLVLDRPLPLAWAPGRHIVVVTTGLLSFCRGGELAGVLAHEAAHQLEGHSVRRLVLRALSLSGEAAKILGWATLCLGLALTGGGRKNPVGDTAAFLAGVLARGFRLWEMIGKALLCALFRREEYAADAFAVRLGFGEGLAGYLGRLAFMDQLRPGQVWGWLWLAHPPYHRRLERLRQCS